MTLLLTIVYDCFAPCEILCYIVNSLSLHFLQLPNSLLTLTHFTAPYPLNSCSYRSLIKVALVAPPAAILACIDGVDEVGASHNMAGKPQLTLPAGQCSS